MYNTILGKSLVPSYDMWNAYSLVNTSSLEGLGKQKGQEIYTWRDQHGFASTVSMLLSQGAAATATWTSYDDAVAITPFYNEAPWYAYLLTNASHADAADYFLNNYWGLQPYTQEYIDLYIRSLNGPNENLAWFNTKAALFISSSFAGTARLIASNIGNYVNSTERNFQPGAIGANQSHLGDTESWRFQLHRLTVSYDSYLNRSTTPAIEFIGDIPDGTSYVIPNIAFAGWLLADLNWKKGWTTLDVRAALRQSSHNYPEYGYNRAVLQGDGNTYGGWGFPDLEAAMLLQTEDLHIFAPFLNTWTYSEDILTITGCDWVSAVRQNLGSYIVHFTEQPTASSVPQDGTILWQGNFEDHRNIDRTPGDIQLEHTVLIDASDFWIGVFTEHVDGSYSRMTEFERDDASIFNMNAYYIV